MSGHTILTDDFVICVDKWDASYLRRPGSLPHYFFLTHLHADHIKGLSSSWSRLIYTSPLNAWLLPKRRGVKPILLKELDLNVTHTVRKSNDGAVFRVTLIDANHCPGAVMFLFQGSFGNILYTGDFRYCSEILENPILSPLVRKKEIGTLYLDNTYAAVTCNFPSRDEALEEVLKIVDKHPDHKILVGMRQLGKEEVLRAIALHINERVCVSPQRLEVLERLEYEDVFTVDENQSRIHAVELHTVNQRQNQDSSSKTISIKLTSMYECAKLDNTRGNVYIVPYSDHSSHSELKHFVERIRPLYIVPIVPTKLLASRSSNGPWARMSSVNCVIPEDIWAFCGPSAKLLPVVETSPNKQTAIKFHPPSRGTTQDCKTMNLNHIDEGVAILPFESNGPHFIVNNKARKHIKASWTRLAPKILSPKGISFNEVSLDKEKESSAEKTLSCSISKKLEELHSLKIHSSEDNRIPPIASDNVVSDEEGSIIEVPLSEGDEDIDMPSSARDLRRRMQFSTKAIMTNGMENYACKESPKHTENNSLQRHYNVDASLGTGTDRRITRKTAAVNSGSDSKREPNKVDSRDSPDSQGVIKVPSTPLTRRSLKETFGKDANIDSVSKQVLRRYDSKESLSKTSSSKKSGSPERFLKRTNSRESVASKFETKRTSPRIENKGLANRTESEESLLKQPENCEKESRPRGSHIKSNQANKGKESIPTILIKDDTSSIICKESVASTSKESVSRPAENGKDLREIKMPVESEVVSKQTASLETPSSSKECQSAERVNKLLIQNGATTLTGVNGIRINSPGRRRVKCDLDVEKKLEMEAAQAKEALANLDMMSGSKLRKGISQAEKDRRLSLDAAQHISKNSNTALFSAPPAPKIRSRTNILNSMASNFQEGSKKAVELKYNRRSEPVGNLPVALQPSAPQSNQELQTSSQNEAAKTSSPKQVVKTLSPKQVVKTLSPKQAAKTPSPKQAVKTLSPKQAVKTSSPKQLRNTPSPNHEVKDSGSSQSIREENISEQVSDTWDGRPAISSTEAQISQNISAKKKAVPIYFKKTDPQKVLLQSIKTSKASSVNEQNFKFPDKISHRSNEVEIESGISVLPGELNQPCDKAENLPIAKQAEVESRFAQPMSIIENLKKREEVACQSLFLSDSTLAPKDYAAYITKDWTRIPSRSAQKQNSLNVGLMRLKVDFALSSSRKAPRTSLPARISAVKHFGSGNSHGGIPLESKEKVQAWKNKISLTLTKSPHRRFRYRSNKLKQNERLLAARLPKRNLTSTLSQGYHGDEEDMETTTDNGPPQAEAELFEGNSDYFADVESVYDKTQDPIQKSKIVCKEAVVLCTKYDSEQKTVGVEKERFENLVEAQHFEENSNCDELMSVEQSKDDRKIGEKIRRSSRLVRDESSNQNIEQESLPVPTEESLHMDKSDSQKLMKKSKSISISMNDSSRNNPEKDKLCYKLTEKQQYLSSVSCPETSANNPDKDVSADVTDGSRKGLDPHPKFIESFSRSSIAKLSPRSKVCGRSAEKVNPKSSNILSLMADAFKKSVPVDKSSTTVSILNSMADNFNKLERTQVSSSLSIQLLSTKHVADPPPRETDRRDWSIEIVPISDSNQQVRNGVPLKWDSRSESRLSLSKLTNMKTPESLSIELLPGQSTSQVPVVRKEPSPPSVSISVDSSPEVIDLTDDNMPRSSEVVAIRPSILGSGRYSNQAGPQLKQKQSEVQPSPQSVWREHRLYGQEGASVININIETQEKEPETPHCPVHCTCGAASRRDLCMGTANNIHERESDGLFEVPLSPEDFEASGAMTALGKSWLESCFDNALDKEEFFKSHEGYLHTLPNKSKPRKFTPPVTSSPAQSPSAIRKVLQSTPLRHEASKPESSSHSSCNEFQNLAALQEQQPQKRSSTDSDSSLLREIEKKIRAYNDERERKYTEGKTSQKRSDSLEALQSAPSANKNLHPKKEATEASCSKTNSGPTKRPLASTGGNRVSPSSSEAPEVKKGRLTELERLTEDTSDKRHRLSSRRSLDHLMTRQKLRSDKRVKKSTLNRF